jgi:hypothetical protein
MSAVKIPMIGHSDSSLLGIVQKPNIILNPNLPRWDPRLVLLPNRILDKHMNPSGEIIFQMLDLQVVGDSLLIALMIQNRPVEYPVMESLWTGMTDVFSFGGTQLVVLSVETFNLRVIDAVRNSAYCGAYLTPT